MGESISQSVVGAGKKSARLYRAIIYVSMGFKNEVFKTLNHVVDRLCDTICNLTNESVKSITCRQWISDALLI